MNKKIALVALALLSLTIVAFTIQTGEPDVEDGQLPKGFVYVDEVIPNIVLDMRYTTTNNFVGAPIDAYNGNRCILTKEAADALKLVQEDLAEFGMGLKIFDAYRPQKAVDHFARWAEDLDDDINKGIYYPDVPKDQLFEKGYIAAKSGHSRGSTADLTIISLKEGEDREELFMGTRFDFFGPESWPNFQEISLTSRAHRKLLQLVMEKHGFKHLPEEWWHFTLADEPYPDTYFNFPVE